MSQPKKRKITKKIKNASLRIKSININTKKKAKNHINNTMRNFHSHQQRKAIVAI